MKIVHSWLAELAPVGDDVDKVAEVMTDVGLVVDDIAHVGATVDGVITARVVRTERHPDAAKVHRVYVDAGDGRERHVWCGAFNMQAGDIVPLATPGTAMPDGRVIEPKPILGIQSDGMLCSAPASSASATIMQASSSSPPTPRLACRMARHCGCRPRPSTTSTSPGTCPTASATSASHVKWQHGSESL